MPPYFCIVHFVQLLFTMDVNKSCSRKESLILLLEITQLCDGNSSPIRPLPLYPFLTSVVSPVIES